MKQKPKPRVRTRSYYEADTGQFQQICPSESTLTHQNKGLTNQIIQNHQVCHSSCRRALGILQGKVHIWEGRWGLVPARITLPLSSLLSSAMSPPLLDEKHWLWVHLSRSSVSIWDRKPLVTTGCAGWHPLSSAIPMNTSLSPHPGGSKLPTQPRSTANSTITLQVELLQSTSTEHWGRVAQESHRSQPGQARDNPQQYQVPQMWAIRDWESLLRELCVWTPTP